MADDNAYANGRTPSPRRDKPSSEYKAPAERETRDKGDREDRGDRDRDSRPTRQDGPTNNPGNNLHVRGLAMRTNEKDLEEIFSQFGAIEKCQIMRDPRTRDSRGFAFVTFTEIAAAEEAMNALNATTLDDKVITVEKAKRGRARTPTPGQYQGAEGRPRYGGGPPGGSYGGGRDRDYPPRRYDDRDDRRGGYGDRDDRRGGYGDRSYAAPMRGDPYLRDRDPRPPPRDDRRRDTYDRPPPRRDEPRRERRDYDDAPRRY